MKVLELNQRIFQLIGIFQHKESNNTNKFAGNVIKYSCVLFQVLFVIPTLAYFVKNVNDVAKATDALYIAGVVGITASKFICYLGREREIKLIVGNLQNIVDGSK